MFKYHEAQGLCTVSLLITAEDAAEGNLSVSHTEHWLPEQPVNQEL